MTSENILSKVVEVSRNHSEVSLLYRDIPFVIKAEARNWPAFQKWTLPYLLEKAPDISIGIRNAKQGGKNENLSLRKFLAMQMANDPQTADLYMGGWNYLSAWPELGDDIRTPKAFEGNCIHAFQSVVKFPNTTMFMGNKGTSTRAHTDVFMVGTYLAQLRGQKAIRLCDSLDNTLMTAEKNLFDEGTVKLLVEKGHSVIDVFLDEGDIVYFPPGWWHQVNNLNFSLAISTNHVSRANLLVFEQQIRAKILRPFLSLQDVRNLPEFAEALAHPASESIRKYASFDLRESEYKESILFTMQELGLLLTKANDRRSA